jgi:hypothetical protein
MDLELWIERLVFLIGCMSSNGVSVPAYVEVKNINEID